MTRAHCRFQHAQRSVEIPGNSLFHFSLKIASQQEITAQAAPLVKFVAYDSKCHR